MFSNALLCTAHVDGWSLEHDSFSVFKLRTAVHFASSVANQKRRIWRTPQCLLLSSCLSFIWKPNEISSQKSSKSDRSVEFIVFYRRSVRKIGGNLFSIANVFVFFRWIELTMRIGTLLVMLHHNFFVYCCCCAQCFFCHCWMTAMSFSFLDARNTAHVCTAYLSRTFQPNRKKHKQSVFFCSVAR